MRLLCLQPMYAIHPQLITWEPACKSPNVKDGKIDSAVGDIRKYKCLGNKGEKTILLLLLREKYQHELK